MTVKKVLWLPDVVYTPEEDRTNITAFLFPDSTTLNVRQGVFQRPSLDGYEPLQVKAGTGMQSTVGAGQCAVKGVEAGRGVYIVTNDGTVTVEHDPADPTYPRIDSIFVGVNDSNFGSSTNDARIIVWEGTPAEFPVAPTLPDTAFLLCNVRVEAGATSTGTYTDMRQYASAAGGRLLCTSGTRPSPACVGMQIYELDTKIAYDHDGTAWVLAYQLAEGGTGATDVVVSGTTFTAIQNAINSAPTGGIVFIPAGTYTSEGVAEISVNKALTIRGAGNSTILSQTTSPSRIFEVTASNVTIKEMALRGPQYANYIAEYAIRVMGASGGRLTDFTCENVQMQTFGHSALWIQYVDNFRVEGCRMRYLQRSGILGLSVTNGLIYSNHIRDMILTAPNTNHYPIAVTRDKLLSISVSPRSENIVISDNLVENTVWEGIETHGGKDITITGNVVRNSLIGIAAVPSTNELDVDTYAPLNITIVGNTVDSRVTTGTKQAGIKVVGPTNSPPDGGSAEFATGVITGNTVIGHGTESNSISGAVLIYGTSGMVVSGNTILNPSPHGVTLYHDNIGASINGNTILNPWSNTYASPAGVALMSTYNEPFIGGNVIDKAGDFYAGKTYYLVNGVYAVSDANSHISWGQNRITGYTGAEASIGASTSSTHGFTGMTLVANANNPMFGLGRSTSTTGFVAQTSASTGAMTRRSLVAGSGISITNPDGVSGNPIISAAGAGGTWNTTTVVWGSSGDAPSLGNGSLTAHVLDTGSFYILGVALVMGSTTAFGSGTYNFSFPSLSFWTTPMMYGSGAAYNSSYGIVPVTPYVTGGTTLNVYAAPPGGYMTLTARTVPWSWASGNTLKFTILVRE